jgi:carbonic anhydrase/acetyltransferase-like protein (isoleucine patch superfamily)
LINPASFGAVLQSTPNHGLEAFVAQTPENTQLFNISGALVEKNTESYVGSGSATFSGALVEKNTESYVGSGSITLSGVEVEKNTESYVGSGSITPGRSYIPPVPLVQTFDQTQAVFDIDGNALPTYASFDKDYLIFDKFNVATVSPLTFDNTLRNPASVDALDLQSIPNHGLEAFVAQTPENIQLFSISGSLVEKVSVIPPQETTTIVISGRQSGTSKYSYIASGSITLSGVEVEKNTESYVGSGSATFSGALVEKNTESYVGSGSLNISGVEVEKNTESYVGTGTVVFSGGYSNLKVTSPLIGSGSITLSGVEVEKNTESYVGSGSIIPGRSYIPPVPLVQTFDQTQAVFDIDGNALPTYVSFDKDYLIFDKFNVSTVSPLTFDNTLRNPASVGSQTQSIPNHGLEAFVAQTPENTQLFSFSGSIIEKFGKGLYTGLGTINVYGSGGIPASISYIGSGSITLSGAEVEKNTESYVGSGSATFSGALVEKFTPATHIGSGSITISGVEVEKNTESYVGSGTVAFSGGYSNLKVTSPLIGSGSITLSGVEVEKNTESYVGSGSITPGRSYIPPVPLLQTFDQTQAVFDIDGNKLPTYVSFDKDYLIFDKFNVATVSPLTFDNTLRNPASVGAVLQSIPNHGLEVFVAQTPENIQLFSISGSLVEKVSVIPPQETETILISGRQSGTSKYSYVASGSITLSGVEIEKNTESYVGSGSATFSGALVEKNTESYVGSGSITLSGVEVEKNTESYVGGGTVAFSGGYSNLKVTSPLIGSGSIVLSGVEVEKNTESYVGSGSITPGRSYIPPVPLLQTFDQTQAVFDIDGNALPTYVSFDKDYLNFAQFNVATVSPLTFDNTLRNPASIGAVLQSIPNHGLEAFVANPPENIQLFSISGSGVESTTSVPPQETETINIRGAQSGASKYFYRAFGSITLSGAEVEKNTESYVGSGSATFSGALVEKFTPATHIGSGSITISGVEVEKNTESYVGSGSATFSGAYTDLKATNSWSGSGSITLSGVEVEKNVESYVGTGTIIPGRSYIPPVPLLQTFDQTQAVFDIDGNALPTYASFDKDYLNFSKFNVATVSPLTFDNTLRNPASVGAVIQSIPSHGLEAFVAQTPENIQLFSISGSLVEKNTESYVGSGSATFSGALVEKNTESYVGSGSITLSGVEVEKNTESYVGSGSINISGVKVEKNTESYVGIGSITLSGVEVEKNTESYVGSGSIIVSGIKTEKNAESYSGTGTVTFSGIGAESITPTTYIGVGIVTFGRSYILPSGRTFDETRSAFDIDDNISPTYVSFDKDYLNFAQFNVATVSPLTFDNNLDNPESIGVGLQSLPNYALESFTINPPENVSLFTISGSFNNLQITNSWFGSGSIVVSGIKTEKNTESYAGRGTVVLSGIGGESITPTTHIGSGSIVLSGIKTEKNTESYVGTGTVTLSGAARNSITPATHIGLGTIIISSALNESYTRLGYFGSGSIVISGVEVEKNVESYVGLGTLVISGKPLVHPNVDYTPAYTGIGTIIISGSIFAPKVSKYIGISTNIVIYGQAKTQSILPIGAFGGIGIAGTALESFTKSRYTGIGTTRFSGLSSTREIQVYGYYGDQNNPGASGIIYINGTRIEKNTESYVGSGSIVLSATRIEKNTESYRGSGSIVLSGSKLERFEKQSQISTNLFVISGTKRESFTPSTYIGVGTATLSGKNVTSLLFKSERGSGVITLSSSASTTLEADYPLSGVGGFRFVRYVTDEDYDTCDSTNITSDYLNSARFALSVNPPENTQLFNISGNASTKEINTYTFNGSGSIGISGSLSDEKITKSVFGYGSIVLGAAGERRKVHSYNGTGTINVSSVSANSLVKILPSSTSLFTISGSSETSINRLFTASGIGTGYFNSSAETRNIATYTQVGLGTISLSGELVYPNVKFIPSPDGSGGITIVGSSDNKQVYNYSTSSGKLFTLSTVKESITRATYIGVGTIYVQSTSSTTINNPFQIPRTYVCII